MISKNDFYIRIHTHTQSTGAQARITHEYLNEHETTRPTHGRKRKIKPADEKKNTQRKKHSLRGYTFISKKYTIIGKIEKWAGEKRTHSQYTTPIFYLIRGKKNGTNLFTLPTNNCFVCFVSSFGLTSFVYTLIIRF